MGFGKLAHRIHRQPQQASGHMDGWQPVPQGDAPGAAAGDRPGFAGRPMQGHHPVPPQEMVMPMSVVYVTGDATVVEEAAPLVTSRGVVPATSPGQWDQIRAAG